MLPKMAVGSANGALVNMRLSGRDSSGVWSKDEKNNKSAEEERRTVQIKAIKIEKKNSKKKKK
jgi:hypothetical protein